MNNQEQQALTFVYELAMGAYRYTEIEKRAKEIARMAPLEVSGDVHFTGHKMLEGHLQQDADRMDAQPSDEAVFEIFKRNCVNYSGNYEVSPGQALRITKTLLATAQPDPAAGDGWLAEHRALVAKLADIAESQSLSQISLYGAIEALDCHARQRVQPASGEEKE